MTATPRVLAVLDDVLASLAPGDRGAVWHLAETRRELDANLVHLPAEAEVAEHQEDTLDVLVVVLAGSGRLTTGRDTLHLTPTTVTWLPRTSRRALAAGPEGLSYLTVHRRRPGLSVTPPPAPAILAEGGEAPCMLDRVCPSCGRVAEGVATAFCAGCGERRTGR
ncbi:hypothetical protein [Streptomyces fulvorobeus]|uniref:Quercetin dioxygenase-like cupin family protein n=1 Tax=Streptomyces fulvorobeus TaxID=284028 RepID=A0A7Y9HDX8_9ACTN|nr:hypothetical protein [Streptomyces fulvorobeus]NYE42249.1 quercetin dioxygenase-like cupin family protein [Streptomyces fulvorobeus]